VTDPQIPRTNEILGAGYEAFIASRPSAAKHLVTGRYGDLFAGWRAQCQLVLSRLTSEAVAARLPLARGNPLLDLLASEFDALIDPAPTQAVGQVILKRSHDAPGDFTGGLIRKGTKFRRVSDPTSMPRALPATYESTEPVYAGTDSTFVPFVGYYQSLTIPIKASIGGSASNIARGQSWIISDDASPPIELSDTLFDTFTVTYGEAAGGSDGPSVAKLRSLGRALGQGQYGPTGAALLAGLLLTDGVSHAALYEDTTTGKSKAWIADDSWAWSHKLRSAALQNLADKWLGFGGSVSIGVTSTLPAAVEIAATLRDKRDLNDTSTIEEKMRVAVRSYFEDRGDWYVWRDSGIKAACMRSSRKLLEVTAVSVKDLEGNALSEPSGLLSTIVGYTPIVHRQVDDTAITITFSAAS